MNILAKIVAAVFTIVSISPAQSAWFDSIRVSDRVLSHVHGTGAPTTRLSRLVAEQGATNSQLSAENTRVAFDNWFADTNVQQIANAALQL